MSPCPSLLILVSKHLCRLRHPTSMRVSTSPSASWSWVSNFNVLLTWAAYEISKVSAFLWCHSNDTKNMPVHSHLLIEDGPCQRVSRYGSNVYESDGLQDAHYARRSASLREDLKIEVISHSIHGTGIFAYIYHQIQPNVGKYSMHGWYGYEMIQTYFDAHRNSNTDAYPMLSTCLHSYQGSSEGQWIQNPRVWQCVSNIQLGAKMGQQLSIAFSTNHTSENRSRIKLTNCSICSWLES